LKVFHLEIPPLRKRREDIPCIARAFLEELNRANGTHRRFSKNALSELATGHYRGNVRELQNVVERAYLTASENTIRNVTVDSAAGSERHRDEVVAWFKDLREGRANFWSTVHRRYKARDISREKVLALMDLGLRETRGSYTSVARLFHLKKSEQRKFLDFLRRNHCLPDFRPYRKLNLE
jgi:DNA-binding NtrC family response regulator